MAKTVGRILVGDFPISQIFGVNPAYYAQYGLVGHNGIDITAPFETAVLAGVTGVVQFVGFSSTGYGKYVVVWDQSQLLVLLFAHLNSVAPLIQVGNPVNPGNPIGGVGQTGKVTGVHLHFAAGDTDIAGMRINRENGFDGWLDPLDTNYLNLEYPRT